MRIRSQGQAENPSARTHHYFNDVMCNRDCPRFFDQVGHQTTYAYIGNKHFSLNHVFVRPTKIMNNLVKDLKILSFKVIFKCLKLVESFQKEFSVKNI